MHKSDDQFLVFMRRSHISKLKITFPSEVLFSSDKKHSGNLTFHNVLAQRGSFCNRARLDFQAFTLRDMKLAAREFLRPVYTGDFCRGNSMQFLSRCGFQCDLSPGYRRVFEHHVKLVATLARQNFIELPRQKSPV